MTITIAVDDVEKARNPKPTLNAEAAFRALLHQPVEAIHKCHRRLVCCDDTHPLIRAAHDAFFEHRRLVLSPDVVWLSIAQGFAHHIIT